MSISPDSTEPINLTLSKPLDVAEPQVKSLVASAEAPEAKMSLQPVTAQVSVAAAYPVGNILVESVGVVTAPPLRRRRFRPHVRPLHMPAVHIPVKVHTLDSFSYRDYRFLWAATLFSSAGFWLQQIIVGWLTYQLTQSALMTSIAMGLDALPILFAGPVGGVLVDSWDKRKLLSIIFAYQTVLALLFGAVVLLGLLQTWHIFGFIFLMGISWVINDPARMSLIPSLVPKENLVNAFALNSLAFSITRFAAPAIGGVLLALVGAGPAVLLQAMVLMLAVLMALKLNPVPSTKAKPKLNKVASEILEAVRYIKSEPVIRGLLAFSILPPILVIPFLHGLIPVYAAEVYMVGPGTLGLLMASVGAGSIIGTLTLASFGNLERRGLFIVGFLGLAAISMALFSWSPSVNFAIPVLMLGSIGVMGYFSTTIATLQSRMPAEIRGRVTGIYIMAFGLMPVGSVAAGMIAESLGAPTATMISSVVVLVAAIGLSLKFPQVWRVR